MARGRLRDHAGGSVGSAWEGRGWETWETQGSAGEELGDMGTWADAWERSWETWSLGVEIPQMHSFHSNSRCTICIVYNANKKKSTTTTP